MSKAVCTDAQLIRLIEAVGVARAARQLRVTKRAVDFRRRAIEARTGIAIETSYRTR
jgi:hypothetical protein